MPNSKLLRCLVLFLASAGWIAALPGCSDKDGTKVKKKNNGPKVVRDNLDEMWTDIFAQGESGKFFIRQGFTTIQNAATPEKRDEGYKDIVRGWKDLDKAIGDGDDLIEVAEQRHPGQHFPEWERAISDWSAEKVKAEKTLPDEYIDMLHK